MKNVTYSYDSACFLCVRARARLTNKQKNVKTYLLLSLFAYDVTAQNDFYQKQQPTTVTLVSCDAFYLLSSLAESSRGSTHKHIYRIHVVDVENATNKHEKKSAIEECEKISLFSSFFSEGEHARVLKSSKWLR